MSKVKQFTLLNSQGMEVTILNLGARISSILFPIGNRLKEMTLTYSSVNKYKSDPFYMGATVGRVSNRIENASFWLSGKEYNVNKNNQKHCLHGGEIGFSHRNWHACKEKITSNYIELQLKSEDGDQGFPGNVQAFVSYFLTEDNTIEISYRATTDRDTIVGLCNHCYFHLGESDINDLSLYMNASYFLPNNESGIPIGQYTPVENTEFSFKEYANLGSRIADMADKQLSLNQGFDHCFVVDDIDLIKPVAMLKGKANGVELSVFSDFKGIQLYTGQYLSGHFKPYQGVCLEAQVFPNAINQKGFPSPVLKAGKIFKHNVVYQFKHRYI